MVICPWCGTGYLEFQSNCTNCGGPIPLPPQFVPEAEAGPRTPPLPPRQVPSGYLSRRFWSNGSAITGFIFGTLGLVFGMVGGILTLTLVAAPVGLPFVFMGILFLAGGGGMIAWYTSEAQRTLQVLREGQAVLGRIQAVEENYLMRINGRHPWTVSYQFDYLGRSYQGKVSSLRPPAPTTRPGGPVFVLVDPARPERHTLYPDL